MAHMLFKQVNAKYIPGKFLPRSTTMVSRTRNQRQTKTNHIENVNTNAITNYTRNHWNIRKMYYFMKTA